MKDRENTAADIAFIRAILARPSADDTTRPVCVTAYEGAYGPAGVVLTIQGSPPRATVIYRTDYSYMFLIQHDRAIACQRWNQPVKRYDRLRAAVVRVIQERVKEGALTKRVMDRCFDMDAE